MRYPVRSAIVAFLILSLLNIPSFAANEKPLGLVTHAYQR